MTEYKRWLPVILFSIFLFTIYTLSKRSIEPFSNSPFSLSGSGIQIRFQQEECLDDLSWISQDQSVTCPALSSSDPRCNFVDVNGFTGFEKCPRSCGNCQDQLFPGDSANDAMLSAPDALYDNESGEMIGQVRQGGEMTMGGSTMATFSDKRLYEIKEKFDERLGSMEESISGLLESVYDDILLAVAEQSGTDVTCLKNSDTSNIPDGKTISTLTEEEKEPLNIPEGCTDLHLDGYGATYCDSIGGLLSDSDDSDNCLKCGNAEDNCDTNYEITTTGSNMDSIYQHNYEVNDDPEQNLENRCITVPNTFSTTINSDVTTVLEAPEMTRPAVIAAQVALNAVSFNGISNDDYGQALGAALIDDDNLIESEWGASEREECCITPLADMSEEVKNKCFRGGATNLIRPRNECCFTPYELNFPSYKRGSGSDAIEIPKTKYKLNVNLNEDQEQINVHNLDKCINNSKTDEFEVFKWIPTNVTPDGDEFDQMPTDLAKDNSEINRNSGIMLPLNVKTNCYELKDMEKYFGPELTDYSCKNQIFTKSIYRNQVEWTNLYERCPIRCNENCRNLFDPSNDLGLQLKATDENVNLYSDLETHPDAHYESNVDYLKKISNKLYNDDNEVIIDGGGERYMIDDIKKYLGVRGEANENIDTIEPYEAGINQANMNIKIDDSNNP